MPDIQSQSTLIQLAGLGRVFDTDAGRVRALKDVSLSISAGEFVCITGASGSGKSTLLNIIGCLDRPTEGSYRFAGRDVEGLGDSESARLRRLAFGFVFQDYALLDAMTAVRNVELPAEYAGITVENRKRQAAELLRSFGLEDRQLHLPAELSGGEQQRVAIARALMNGWSWSLMMRLWRLRLTAGFNCSTAPSRTTRGRSGKRRRRYGLRR